MKTFFKSVLANIVAIFIVFFSVFLFFIVIITISTFKGKSTPSIRDNTLLTIDLNTYIIDSPTEDRDSFFDIKNSTKKILLIDIINAIKHAETDDKIKGISIETDALPAGITQLDNIRKALEDFKKTGKFVYAYGNNISQSAYYLASVANEFYLHPAGGIDLKGLATEVIFFKNFFDKYGIEAEVIRHGKYKAAVEPYLQNQISEENKHQLSTLLNDIWKDTANKISKSRKIDSIQFKNIVDNIYGIIPDNALRYKLADQLIQKTEYDDLLRNKMKIEKNKKLNKLPIHNYAKHLNEQDISKKDKIAILYANGAIYNGEGYEDIHAVDFIKNIQKLKEDKKVKAIVLRINSPGGSANASDEILFELKELKKTGKPLVVSFGDYAASGGYYIAMAADKIYSEKNTLTGSIGVFGVFHNAGELANRNGIRSDVVKTNENANYFSPLHGLTPDGKDIFTKSVESTYNRFVHFVTQNRNKTYEEIDAIGGGRVWSGKRAKEIDLVDELGSINDAILFAAKKAQLKDYQIYNYPEKLSIMEDFLQSMEEDSFYTRIFQNQLGEKNYQLFKTIKKMNKQPTNIFMQCEYNISLD